MTGMQKILNFKELTLKRSIRPFWKKNIMNFFSKNPHMLSDDLREVITEERTT